LIDELDMVKSVHLARNAECYLAQELAAFRPLKLVTLAIGHDGINRKADSVDFL
jgi:hypothetical protein